VHRRLHDADQGLLAAGELGAHGPGQVLDAEPAQPVAGGFVRIPQALQPAVQAQELDDPHVLR
jgi:hypothetical protein